MTSPPRRGNRKEDAVSLLNRIGRGHLDEATLASLWAESVDGRAPQHPHLAGCADCRQRLTAFGSWADGLADELREEADAAFTPDRLGLQQAQIARRLEALDRPARVIAFPKAARAVINGHSHVRRWVTVAAAASLIAGFGLGQVMPLRRELRRQQSATAVPLTKSKSVELAKDITAVPSSVTDEELLSDSFSRAHVAALSALDDMTPHARDTVLNRRTK
jgi:hypothetical protein